MLTPIITYIIQPPLNNIGSINNPPTIKTAAYFTYNSLVGVLGYSSYKNNRKRKDIIRLLETLRDMKLINYVLDTKEQRFAKFRVIEIGV